jgi:aminotransferase EvaB
MFDYRRSDAAAHEEIVAAIRTVLDSGQLILGPRVSAFEEHIASFLAAPGTAIGVGNGTDALAIALRAMGVGPGDEVITVPNTAIPTVSAIRMVGAVPVFVDVDPETCLLDLHDLPRRISARTRAIVPVHLYGNAVPMQPLLDLARQHSIHVIEDCAQSLGTVHFGRATGTYGDIGCFSFYPTKNLGAYGDAGMCFTRDPEIANVLRQIRMYGCGARYYAEREGSCSRLDEIQAAILDVKLTRLTDAIRARREIAAWYDAMLDPAVPRISTTHGTDHSYQLFVIRAPRREELTESLAAERIGFGIHYAVPIHLMRAYEFLGYKRGDFPVSEQLARVVLSLPCYPGLTADMVRRVCDVVNSF